MKDKAGFQQIKWVSMTLTWQIRIPISNLDNHRSVEIYPFMTITIDSMIF